MNSCILIAVFLSGLLALSSAAQDVTGPFRRTELQKMTLSEQRRVAAVYIEFFAAYNVDLNLEEFDGLYAARSPWSERLQAFLWTTLWMDSAQADSSKLCYYGYWPSKSVQRADGSIVCNKPYSKSSKSFVRSLGLKPYGPACGARNLFRCGEILGSGPQPDQVARVSKQLGFQISTGKTKNPADGICIEIQGTKDISDRCKAAKRALQKDSFTNGIPVDPPNLPALEEASVFAQNHCLARPAARRAANWRRYCQKLKEDIAQIRLLNGLERVTKVGQVSCQSTQPRVPLPRPRPKRFAFSYEQPPEYLDRLPKCYQKEKRLKPLFDALADLYEDPACLNVTAIEVQGEASSRAAERGGDREVRFGAVECPIGTYQKFDPKSSAGIIRFRYKDVSLLERGKSSLGFYSSADMKWDEQILSKPLNEIKAFFKEQPGFAKACEGQLNLEPLKGEFGGDEKALKSLEQDLAMQKVCTPDTLFRNKGPNTTFNNMYRMFAQLRNHPRCKGQYDQIEIVSSPAAKGREKARALAALEFWKKERALVPKQQNRLKSACKVQISSIGYKSTMRFKSKGAAEGAWQEAPLEGLFWDLDHMNNKNIDMQKVYQRLCK